MTQLLLTEMELADFILPAIFIFVIVILFYHVKY